MSYRDAKKMSASIKASADRLRSRKRRVKWGAGCLASDAQVARIAELRAAGKSVREIAKAVRVSKTTVGRLVQRL